MPELMPHTLSDCLHELAYWNELYRLRNACDTQGYYENSIEAHARDWFVFGLLAELRPRNREEARATLRYLMGSERDDAPRGRRDLGEPARVISQITRTSRGMLTMSRLEVRTEQLEPSVMKPSGSTSPFW